MFATSYDIFKPIFRRINIGIENTWTRNTEILNWNLRFHVWDVTKVIRALVISMRLSGRKNRNEFAKVCDQT